LNENKTKIGITVEQAKYVPSIIALRLFLRAHCPIASTYLMLIDAPLGTNFPEKVANMPKVSNRRLRDIAIIDVVDNKPFDVPAS
jgi:hypothetical protein